MRDQLVADDRQLIEACALADLGPRTIVELRGDDRAKFLHNLCTNNITGLAVGQGCEAFLLNAQGKTLAHVLVFASDDALRLETVAGQAEFLSKHLDRYLIRERVEIVDRTGELRQLLLAGPLAPGVLRQLGIEPPEKNLSTVDATISGIRGSIARVDFTGPDCFFVTAAVNDFDEVWGSLASAGAKPVSEDAVEAARIERGWPLFVRDITDANLPQEVNRDERAINLNKGCYLGQETVARIDALGHVNRRLVRVQFSGEAIPPSGTQLFAGDKPVGQVTSAAWSPRSGAPIALAYVRRGHDSSGAEGQSEADAATWKILPTD
jgi:tRNA-modifying protein YgfZ